MNFSNFLKRIALQLLFWFLQTDVGRVCLLSSFVIVLGVVLKQTITDWLRGPETASEAARVGAPESIDGQGLSMPDEAVQKARIVGIKGLATIGRWSKLIQEQRRRK